MFAKCTYHRFQLGEHKRNEVNDVASELQVWSQCTWTMTYHTLCDNVLSLRGHLQRHNDIKGGWSPWHYKIWLQQLAIVQCSMNWILSSKLCFQVIGACPMLLLSVEYFYNVMLRRGRCKFNITMTLSGVLKSVWRYSLMASECECWGHY